jgi:hypothetical protein
MVLFMTPELLALHPAVDASHFWQGQLPVAFVFSVPGAHEKSAGRPLAGTTGENLSFALQHLHAQLPGVFSSIDRYAYRITNAYDMPIAKSLGNSSSEASDLQVKAPENIIRVLRDISGCNFVILCGLKAQLLSGPISQPSRTVVCAWHTSNQGLSKKFSPLEVSRLPESHARRQLRAKLWARDILKSLRPSNSVA